MRGHWRLFYFVFSQLCQSSAALGSVCATSAVVRLGVSQLFSSGSKSTWPRHGPRAFPGLAAVYFLFAMTVLTLWAKRSPEALREEAVHAFEAGPHQPQLGLVPCVSSGPSQPRSPTKNILHGSMHA